MSTSTQASDGKLSVQRAVEAAIRIGLVFLLAAWCFLIVEPFIIPILWGMIIAIACHPLVSMYVSTPTKSLRPLRHHSVANVR